jgi:hypothetical protein
MSGGQSSFRVLRHGLEVTEMAVSELPGSPLAVWTVKTHDSDPYHSYIVVAFINATLVLSIGETVEEVQLLTTYCNYSLFYCSTVFYRSATAVFLEWFPR